MVFNKTVDAIVIYDKIETYDGITEDLRRGILSKVQEQINNLHISARVERQTYDRAIYLNGDYTNSHESALTQKGQKNKYNLYRHNCLQNTLQLVDASETEFSKNVERYRMAFSSKYPLALIPMGYAIPNHMHRFIDEYVRTR
ncbi:MAG: hypothetical protein IJL88_06365 [Clostridia bacterium]|nr:hypothetical protein [Clostridia bacterium]